MQVARKEKPVRGRELERYLILNYVSSASALKFHYSGLVILYEFMLYHSTRTGIGLMNMTFAMLPYTSRSIGIL